MADEHFDFWFDFSCPYAYLASTQVDALAERTGKTVRYKPMLLGGVFRAAGNEMHNLYAAVQYHSYTLEQFYRQSPDIFQLIKIQADNQNAPKIIGQRAVVNYFARLVRASTQKAKAWRAVAERWQSFGQE